MSNYRGAILLIFSLLGVFLQSCTDIASSSISDSLQNSSESSENVVPAFELNKIDGYGLSIATDINDPGNIIGGHLYWKNNTNELIDMGINGTAINNNGQVVGRAEGQTFIWEENKATINIGRKYANNLGQYSDEEFDETVYPSDINNSGEISGEVEVYVEEYDEEGNVIYTDFWFEGFYWTVDDGFRKVTSYLGTTTGMNDHGQVVGMDAYLRNGGYIWDEFNGMRQLDSSSASVQVVSNAINNLGQVVGDARVETEGDNLSRSKVKQDIAQEILELYSMTETKGLFHYSHVIDIIQDQSFQDNSLSILQNNQQKSKALGSAQLNNSIKEIKQNDLYEMTTSDTYSLKAYIWDEDSGIKYLGTLGGNRTIALDINDNGQVVGYGRDSSGEWKAFYWDEDNGIIKLPDLGGSSQARAINNNGQIVGYSFDSAGQSYPVLWQVTFKEQKNLVFN